LEQSKYLKYYGIESGLAYLLTDKLNGKRHIGPMEDILIENKLSVLYIHKIKGVDSEPIMVVNKENNRAFICSDITSKTNQKLIELKTQTTGIDIELK